MTPRAEREVSMYKPESNDLEVPVQPEVATTPGAQLSVGTERPLKNLRHGGLGSAHGKSILMGEHSVVYGAPAVALPLLDLQTAVSVRASKTATITSDLYTGPLAKAPKELRPVITALRATAHHVGLNIESCEIVISSTVPLERGLGSSAAVSAAMVAAVSNAAGVTLSDSDEFKLVQIAENVAHGTSSGLDAHTVRSLTPVRFQGGKPSDVHVAKPFTFVIADSGTSGSTSAAVNGVRMLREQSPRFVDGIINGLADLAERAMVALGEGNEYDLGSSMREGQEQLTRLGVSAPALDALIEAADKAGALGAKLTGSGLGGCVLALAKDQDHARELIAGFEAAGASRGWKTSLVPSHLAEEYQHPTGHEGLFDNQENA